MWSRNMKETLGGPRRASVALGLPKSRSDPRRASISALGFAQLTEEVQLQLYKKKALSVDDDKKTKSERLKNFIINRIPKGQLKKKGILKDEFDLEVQTKNEKPKIPKFVKSVINAIEGNPEYMKTDGLYRVSGNLASVQGIRMAANNPDIEKLLDKEEDVHVLTGSLKLYFRELNKALISTEAFDSAYKIIGDRCKKRDIKALKEIFSKLPEANKDTLTFLLQHLLCVTKYSDSNRMKIHNLAIVWGPTLMFAEANSIEMATRLMQQNQVIECLLVEFEKIFPL